MGTALITFKRNKITIQYVLVLAGDLFYSWIDTILTEIHSPLE